MEFRIVIVITSLAVILGSVAAAGGQGFTDLGADLIVSGMSDDGRTIVGTLGLSGPIFRWTPGGGVENLGGGGASPAVSGDGSTVAGTFRTGGIDTAAVWADGGGWQSLGSVPGGAPCGNDLSSSWAVSGDGGVIGGLAWHGCSAARAFRWDPTNGMVDLGSLDGNNSRANGVSSDGTVMVGWDEDNTGWWRGVRWTASGEILLDPTGAAGLAHAVNHDGTVIVGPYFIPDDLRAYRWTEASGPQPLEVLDGTPDDWACQPTDLSDDGNLIVGWCGIGFARAGFVWTPETGTVFIEDFLTNLGVTGHEGWFLDTPMAVSPDKRFISGWGADPSGATLSGWIVDIGHLFQDGFESGDLSQWSLTTGGVDP